jgi:hypothetical protein
MNVNVREDGKGLPIVDVEGAALRLRVATDPRDKSPIKGVKGYDIGHSDGDICINMYFTDGTGELIRLNAESIRIPRLDQMLAYTAQEPVTEP